MGTPNDISLSIIQQARSSTFSCGGSVPIKDHPADGDFKTCKRPQIRFGGDGVGINLELPMMGNNEAKLGCLLAACSPATFGRGGEDVLDESYRKASQLDAWEFTTSFCPYTTGIVDVIAQLLLPNAVGGEPRGVRAELYKLNIYSAPNGLFKPHVDTPRSVYHFGSLVVALPLAHTGGFMAIRSHGRETVFQSRLVFSDFAPVIQWTAFYSDCEHEVYTVTSGHRLTLTYILYSVAPASGLTAGNVPGLLDPTQIPLYMPLKLALENPGFLKDGGLLGIWLTHSYAHTSGLNNFLPSSLKGSDMALYETARALGLVCFLRPLLTFEQTGIDGEDEDVTLVGKKFHPLLWADFPIGEAVGEQKMMLHYPSGKLEPGKVRWLNDLDERLEEPALVGIIYGNEAELSIRYSAAALLIEVPKFSQSVKPGAPAFV